eukprot:PRCOL_00003029-RA
MAAAVASRRRAAESAASSLLAALSAAGVAADASPGATLQRAADEGLAPARRRHAPHVVATPASTAQAAEAVRVARALRVPVVPFGAGTSLEGHVHALAGGLSIDTSALDAVVDVCAEDMACVAQAGVRRRALNDHLRDTGLHFSVDPGADASVGGMAATRASGTTAFAHGTMRENVLGLEAVLPSGEILRTGGLARKSSAGLDLKSLLVGSEGTLGLITELTLRLRPRPAAEAAARASFASLADACDAAAALAQSGAPLARCELLDARAVAAVNAYSHTAYDEAPASLFLEWQGEDDDAVARLATGARELIEACGGGGFAFAVDAAERRALWHARHTAYWAALAAAPGKVGWPTDACVPISRLAEYVGETAKELEESGISAPLMAHATDGNAHFILLVDREDAADVARVEAANARLVARAIALGGTVTGEHGLGCGKLKHLESETGAVAVEAMRAIKAALDPEDIFNPFKLGSRHVPHAYGEAL